MMSKILMALLLASIQQVQAQSCNILIHGYTSENEQYFGELPHQVVWDSGLEVNKSAPQVAEGILKEIESCPVNAPVILRPHSYGAAQVFFILGQGRRFQELLPEHPFVKIYKKTSMVISYTGAYHGTPLMDIICSSPTSQHLGSLMGKPCVPTLLSSTQQDVSSFVTTPGVPTYLIYSTKHNNYLGLPGFIIGRYGTNSLTKFNQNDNTLPISATMACENNDPIFHAEGKCRKLDSTYFIDLHHEKKYHHTGFAKDSDYMTRSLEDFKERTNVEDE